MILNGLGGQGRVAGCRRATVSHSEAERGPNSVRNLQYLSMHNLFNRGSEPGPTRGQGRTYTWALCGYEKVRLRSERRRDTRIEESARILTLAQRDLIIETSNTKGQHPRLVQGP